MTNNRSGNALISVLIVVVLMGIIAVIAVPDLRNFLFISKKEVAHEQAKTFQDHIDVWISEQSSLAKAAELFQDGENDTLVPKDPNQIVEIVNSIIGDSKDKFKVDSEGRITTEIIEQVNGFIVITWPKPYRHNHVRVNLHIPDEE